MRPTLPLRALVLSADLAFPLLQELDQVARELAERRRKGTGASEPNPLMPIGVLQALVDARQGTWRGGPPQTYGTLIKGAAILLEQAALIAGEAEIAARPMNGFARK